MVTEISKIEAAATIQTEWRYSAHPSSLFYTYFGMGPRVSNWMLPFRKHVTCKHTYGCFENYLRLTTKTAAFYLMAKGAIGLLIGANIDE